MCAYGRALCGRERRHFGKAAFSKKKRKLSAGHIEKIREIFCVLIMALAAWHGSSLFSIGHNGRDLSAGNRNSSYGIGGRRKKIAGNVQKISFKCVPHFPTIWQPQKTIIQAQCPPIHVMNRFLFLFQFEMSKKSILDPLSKFAFSGHRTLEEG